MIKEKGPSAKFVAGSIYSSCVQLINMVQELGCSMWSPEAIHQLGWSKLINGYILESSWRSLMNRYWDKV